MRGYFKLLNFLAFSVQINPSPTICDGPPSPKTGEGFSKRCWLDDLPMSDGSWVIDFIWKFDLFGEMKSLDSLLSPSGRRWPKAGWGDSSKFLIFLTFSHLIQSLTHHWRGSPSPNGARVFHLLVELRSILLRRNFMDERLPTATARPTTSWWSTGGSLQS